MLRRTVLRAVQGIVQQVTRHHCTEQSTVLREDMIEETVQAVFRGFNPHAAVRVYRRNLPHWRQDGATYFFTFRLADSIPRHVLLAWQDEDRLWLAARGVDGPLSQPQWRTAYESLSENDRTSFERRSARRLHVELDQCHGACVLRSPIARDLALGALQYFHGERWWLGDVVIMPNHVHGLGQPAGGHDLERILGSVKGYVSTRLTKQGMKSGRLWQQENYDRVVRDRDELSVWRRYIQQNPVKARLRDGEYDYQRCSWLDAV